ncbi:hypothetical protein COCON_G00014670 [Conger conger]|uniref:Uncharacterized protein n=1 Tax=Conger conger TaxID=82655 RepID=A0A9Q1I9H1_CONCO|nr:hypothetical protein COCON_G00014670 [Conger conger]
MTGRVGAQLSAQQIPESHWSSPRPERRGRQLRPHDSPTPSRARSRWRSAQRFPTSRRALSLSVTSRRNLSPSVSFSSSGPGLRDVTSTVRVCQLRLQVRVE